MAAMDRNSPAQPRKAAKTGTRSASPYGGGSASPAPSGPNPGTQEDAAGAPRMRADARRNRERIIQAAKQVFAEAGSDAQMDDVAAAAGVGVGTVYRHFP